MSQIVVGPRTISHISEEHIYLLSCPHCNGTITINENEVNCQIFRHAVLKETGNQINPHAPKGECDYLSENNLIYGCGRPFRLFKGELGSDWSYADVCDYI